MCPLTGTGGRCCRHTYRVRGDQGGNQRCEVCGVGESRMKKNETMKNEGCLGGEWNKMYFCRVDKGSVFIVKLPMRAVLAIPRNSPIYSGFFLRSKAVSKNGHFPFAFPRSPFPTRAILGEKNHFPCNIFPANSSCNMDNVKKHEYDKPSLPPPILLIQ